MMFEGKVIDRRGTVEAKNTISDNTEIEQINQRSIYSTPLYTEFMDNKLNIMDTPGADDFIGGVISSFKVCDSGILVVNAQQGVEVGTEIFGRYAESYKKPLVVAVNQLDADKANWETTIDSLKEAFGSKIVLVQFPVAVGAGFNGFIDVLTMKMYTFKDENGTREEHDIPADLKDQADEVLSALTEMAAESDEALMEKYFDAGELTREEIEKGLNLGFLQGSIMPTFCISARKDIGVKKLMEFMINVAPSPAGDNEPTKDGKSVPCSADGPTSIFVFKNALEQHLGDVAYFKVMSGKLTEGMDLVNAENGNKERISQIFAVAGKKREKVSEMVAGDIGCTVKLKTVKSNQTLCAPGQEIVYEPIVYPQAKYRTAIKAVDEKDEEKLGEILNKAAAEDPTYIVQYAKTSTSSSGRSTTSTRWRSSSWHPASPTARPSPRSPQPTTVTRSSPAAPVSSVRFTSFWSPTWRALPRTTASRWTARKWCSTSSPRKNTPWTGAASSSSTTVSSEAPSTHASCPPS